MIHIHIVTPGDSWTNAKEVYHKLLAIDPFIPVVLDFKHEGPSMTALGIVDTVNRYCAKIGRDPKTISVARYLNPVDQIPYKNKSVIEPVNHFFSMARDYWAPVIPTVDAAKPFGFFMGRRTFARGRILADLYADGNALLSVMASKSVAPWIKTPEGVYLEHQKDWLSEEQIAWLKACPVASLDGHDIKDQYVNDPTTNRDIQQFYNQFCCEIVAETFTLGATFFPTEKTIRPMMAAKPFVAYGPINYLERLKDLGFETYSSCWDESYDALEGPARWARIKQILPTVTVDAQARSIALHNRQHLAHLIGLKNF